MSSSSASSNIISLIKKIIKRLYKLYRAKKYACSPLRYTKRVSFELSNLCNYSQIHKKCPIHNIVEPKILPASIIDDVMRTLSKWGFSGTIAYHTYNEPLIDPRLFHFIESAKKSCPNSKIYICSNGWYLTQSLLDELVDCGVSRIHISAYSEKEFQRLELLHAEISYFVERMHLDDRLEVYQGDETRETISAPCKAPLKEIIITHDGRIGLCCVDWKRKYTFGDLNTLPFAKALSNPALISLHHELSKGVRTLDICKRCGWSR